MSSLLNFSRRITVLANRVQGNADKMVRRVALAADQAIVSGTPVDTGRAKSNWIVQRGHAADGVIDPYSEGEAGSTGAANTQAALRQAESVIRNYKGGEEIHITNNLPYIQELNDGSSAQAAPNFVESAVLEATQIVHLARIVDGGPGIV